MPDARHLKWELKQNWMQGGQYSKGLIYLRPVSRLIKLGCPKRCILLAFHGRSNYKLFHGSLIPWQNSRHFATPPLVSPRKEVSQTIAENATPFRSGSGKFPLTNHKHYPDRVISMEFLRTFLGGEVAKCRLFSSLRLFFWSYSSITR